jgi:hypothetical protein
MRAIEEKDSLVHIDIVANTLPIVQVCMTWQRQTSRQTKKERSWQLQKKKKKKKK